jgi:hypothetical protein
MQITTLPFLCVQHQQTGPTNDIRVPSEWRRGFFFLRYRSCLAAGSVYVPWEHSGSNLSAPSGCPIGPVMSDDFVVGESWGILVIHSVWLAPFRLSLCSVGNFKCLEMAVALKLPLRRNSERIVSGDCSPPFLSESVFAFRPPPQNIVYVHIVRRAMKFVCHLKGKEGLQTVRIWVRSANESIWTDLREMRWQEVGEICIICTRQILFCSGCRLQYGESNTWTLRKR